MQHPAKQMTQSITLIEDEDMFGFVMTVLDQQKQTEPSGQQIKQQTVPIECQKQAEDKLSSVTRLQLEKDKHKLLFKEVIGQAFICICEASLVGESKEVEGLLMMTNYRIAFFRKSRKRVDFPFGFLQGIEYQDKKHSMVFHLKTSFLWKFRLLKPKDYQNLKIYLEIYAKSEKISSSFAFTYFLKYHQQKPDFKCFNLQQEYSRMDLANLQACQRVDNQNYQICDTYPPIFYVPSGFPEVQVAIACAHRQFNRIPALSHVYKSIMKDKVILWRSSSYVVDSKSISNALETMYLNSMKCKNEKLCVFEAGAKVNNKMVDEHSFEKTCEVTYLDLPAASAVKISYVSIIELYLKCDRDFIKKILNTKWHLQIIKLLESASTIANKLLNLKNVLVRCQDGWSRTPQLTSLAMLILQPYYRTFEGFQALIMKEFINFGYPFADKLGQRSDDDKKECTIFIQFLDCVSQLIHINPLSFEFNQKYISKLSNLMYTNIFGTFIANSAQEYYQHNVDGQTLPIWGEIRCELTTNAFYQKKYGTLEVSYDISNARFWKEHFATLVAPLRDAYKYCPFAEENSDYINIQCLRIKHENQSLKKELAKQQAEMESLKQQIREKANLK